MDVHCLILLRPLAGALIPVLIRHPQSCLDPCLFPSPFLTGTVYMRATFMGSPSLLPGDAGQGAAPLPPRCPLLLTRQRLSPHSPCLGLHGGVYPHIAGGPAGITPYPPAENCCCIMLALRGQVNFA